MVSSLARMTVYLRSLSTEPLYWLIPMECIEECSKCSTLEISIEALNCLNALVYYCIKFSLTKLTNNFVAHCNFGICSKNKFIYISR